MKAGNSDGPKNIRVMQRVLSLLELVNQRENISLADAVLLADLPKTTAYRLLENLCRLGYLEKDPFSGSYRAAMRVLRLSSRFRDSEWLYRLAHSLISELGRQLVYPIALATPFGTAMIIRDSTDYESPLATTRYGEGTLLPLLKSASGKAYITHCPPPVRDELLRLCGTSELEEHALARHPEMLAQMMRSIEMQGYARTTRSVLEDDKRQVTTLAVPVFSGEDLVACLSLRHLQEGAQPDAVVRQYLGPLQDCARRIGVAVAKR